MTTEPPGIRRWSRFLIVAGIFAVAALTGWNSARPIAPDISSPVVEPGVKFVKSAVANRPALSSGVRLELSRLEEALATAQHPSPENFSGEELWKLMEKHRPDNQLDREQAKRYARLWARADPRGMFDWFQKRGSFRIFIQRGVGAEFSVELFSTWAVTDSDGAVAATLHCREAADRPRALGNIVSKLLETDPARAAAVASAHMGMLAEDFGFSALAATGKDYQSTLPFLYELPAGPERDKMLARYLVNASVIHGKDGNNLWDTVPAAIRQELVDGGFAGMVPYANAVLSDDLIGRLNGMEDMLKAKAAAGDLSAISAFFDKPATAWTERDPAAAISWTLENLKGETRSQHTLELFRAAAGADPDTTLATWQALPAGTLKAKAAGNMAAGAPPDRQAEMDALLATLTPADQALAATARSTAVAELDRLKSRR